MKKLFAHSLLCVTLTVAGLYQAIAQDPQWSQFYSNLVMLNPAFTGSGIGPRVAMNYRGQWVRVPGFYQQGAFSFDQPFFVGSAQQGYGINLSYDRAGEGNLTKIDATLNYALEVPLSDDDDGVTIRLGLGAGFQHTNVNFFALRFPGQISPRDGFILPLNEDPASFDAPRFLPDFHAGIVVYNSLAFLSFTANHLAEPTQRLIKGDLREGIDATLPRKYTASAGLKLRAGPYNDRDRLSISPVVLYKQQGEFNQFDVGLYVDAYPMVFGAWYRGDDAVIGLIGLRLTESLQVSQTFSFGYSYDYTISELTQAQSGGSHEVSLVLEFKQYRNPKFKHRDPPCPKF